MEKSATGAVSEPEPAEDRDTEAGARRGSVDYEGFWDRYASQWAGSHPGLDHIGDEWTGEQAGAARSLEQYRELLDRRLIEPFISKQDVVLEIGVGGGRTASLLLERCQRLIAVDVSSQMLRAARTRLGTERVEYVKTDGLSFDAIPTAVADVCFCYDTMVHLEPRDIFNYLTQIPRLLRGKRLCIFHHTDVLTELGWKKFLSEWKGNLLGRTHGATFSVMTKGIMEQFLRHLEYKTILRNTSWVPRDCIWICQAPAVEKDATRPPAS